MSPQTLQSRLESLYRYLDDEQGQHVHANTVALALEAVKPIEVIEEDAKLTEALRDMARRAFPSSQNNEWAMNDWCSRIIRMMEQVKPGEYARIYHSIYKDEK